VLSEALQYTRSLVADLSPPVLRDHGLPAALQWLGENMKKHDLTVTINVSEVDDLKLPEDQAVLLFQSVRELLINASKHAGTGQATVTLERRNGCLGIHVRDEGNGFEPAASSVAERPNGTLSSKFGLFSIAERMKMLGGTCEIVSAPGQGTSATLMLPVGPKVESEVLSPGSPAIDLQASRHSVRSGLSAPGSRLPSNAPIRVLLVDDHAMMRQGLRTVLDGYADLKVVGEAEDGDEAITAVEQLQPDVVVMDLQMQKKNGIEATSAIKARHPDITIIGLSVNADAKNAESMRKVGAAMLLTKEAAVEQLYAAIQDAVYPSLLWKFSNEKIQA
jgi:CheY-like chemotaxis protein